MPAASSATLADGAARPKRSLGVCAAKAPPAPHSSAAQIRKRYCMFGSAPGRGSRILRDLRQAGGQVPVFGLVVVVPVLVIDHGAFGLGVVVQDADLDVLLDIVLARRHRIALGVGHHAYLLVAFLVERGEWMFLLVLHVDEFHCLVE